MKLRRSTSDATCTTGFLANDDDTVVCVTLELPWLQNRPMVSCIPAGDYTCAYTNHPKHGWVYQVMDVPNRSDILLHVGNTAKDTEGCILLGSTITSGFHAISGSRAAFDKFMALMAEVPSFPLSVVDVASS